MSADTNIIDLVAAWKKRGRVVKAADVLAEDPLAPEGTTSTRFREERGVIVQTFGDLPDERVVYTEEFAKRVAEYLSDFVRKREHERWKRGKIAKGICAAWGNCWKPAEQGGELCTRHRREKARREKARVERERQEQGT